MNVTLVVRGATSTATAAVTIFRCGILRRDLQRAGFNVHQLDTWFSLGGKYLRDYAESGPIRGADRPKGDRTRSTTHPSVNAARAAASISPNMGDTIQRMTLQARLLFLLGSVLVVAGLALGLALARGSSSALSALVLTLSAGTVGSLIGIVVGRRLQRELALNGVLRSPRRLDLALSAIGIVLILVGIQWGFDRLMPVIVAFGLSEIGAGMASWVWLRSPGVHPSRE
jgi:hypothetical protein